jgi:hypothetical protein
MRDFSKRAYNGYMSLFDEFVHASRFARDPRMAELLVDLRLDTRRFSFGIAFVEFHGVTYEPVADGGRAALIVMVNEGFSIVDLAACSLCERRIATRRDVGLALGGDYIARAIAEHGTLRLFADPWRWTSAGRAGAVLLDWRRALFVFDGVREIACDDAALARRVHATTRRMADPPRITFRQKRTNGHAA